MRPRRLSRRRRSFVPKPRLRLTGLVSTTIS